MFTINIKGKDNPKDPRLVKLEMVFFRTDYARVTKVINITGSAKEWDNQTQQFKSKSAEATEKNKRLLELKSSYLKIAEEWEAEGKSWSPVQWSHCFDVTENKKREAKVLSVSTALDSIIENILSRERIKNGKVISSVGTAKNYRDLRTTLTQFTKQKYDRALSSYYFNEITADFVNDYAFFLDKRGLENGNNGGLETRLRRFYGLLYYATKMNIPDIDLTVFERARPKMKSKEFIPKTLSKDVIDKIEKLDRKLLSRLESFYVDLFLFSYYTGGMANIDVAYLTWDCIDKDGNLNYERIKFPKRACMNFNSKARAIVERYKDKCYGNYMLPVFSVKHNTEAKQRGRLKRLYCNLNLALRKVQDLIQSDEKITWYAARGTFITEMLAADIPPVEVAEMAGNSPNTIYKHYYKNTNKNQTFKRANAVLGCK